MALETPNIRPLCKLTILQELNREDLREYKKFIRVSPELFMELVHRVGPRIAKKTPIGDPL